MSTQSLAATATLTHGFSLADVDRAARISVAKQKHAGTTLAREDRHDVAWEAIATLLYACGCGQGHCTRIQPLTFHDLLVAGMHAIRDDARQCRKLYGGSEDADTPQKPNFIKFWLPPRKSKHYEGDGFSDSLLTRMVLRDALGTLSVAHWQAIAALAALENGVEAAKATGLEHSAFTKRIKVARAQLVDFLTGDDGPYLRPVEPVEPACKRGHLRSEFGEKRVKSNGRETYTCTECRRLMARRNIATMDPGVREKRRLASLRHFRHKKGDHSLCLQKNCPEAPAEGLCATAVSA